MTKNNPFKTNIKLTNAPLRWKAIRDNTIIDVDPKLTLREFVRLKKEGSDDPNIELITKTLLHWCATGYHEQAKFAKFILEKCGYTKRQIPREAYIKRIIKDARLRRYQVYPHVFERRVKEIGRYFLGFNYDRNASVETNEEAIREAFAYMFKRFMTKTEWEYLSAKARDFTEVCLFFESVWLKLSYEALRTVYYRGKKKSKKPA